MKKEKSCGCIIIKDNKVLLIDEKNGDFWGFPKGHVEDNETEIETAIREVKEEVGLDVSINDKKRYVLNYNIKNEIDKTVVLFLATPISNNLIMQESEIKNIKWCTFNETLEILTYDNLKDIFKEVIKDIN